MSIFKEQAVRVCTECAWCWTEHEDVFLRTESRMCGFQNGGKHEKLWDVQIFQNYAGPKATQILFLEPVTGL